MIKSFHVLPGPKGWPLLGILPDLIKYGDRMHEMEQSNSYKFGPIHREKILNLSFVVLSHPDLVEKLVRCEDKYPMRPPIISWDGHRDIRNIPRGLVSSYDEEWRRCRIAFSKPLLRPTDVKQYRDVVRNATEQLNFFFDRSCNPNYEVSGTFGKSLDELQKLPDLVTLFKLWSLEIVCSIAFGKNQNFLEYPIDPEFLNFVHAIDLIFEHGKYVYFLPPAVVRNYMSMTQNFNKLMQSWDFIFDFCRKRISDKLRETKEIVKKTSTFSDNSNSEDSKNVGASCQWNEEIGFLEILIQEHPNLSDEEIISCTTEIIVGAIDQTSLTLAEVLGEIGMNENVQRDIRTEVMAMDPSDTSNSVLRAVLKEGFRMFPSMTRVVRTNKTEIELGGYAIPAKSNIMIASYAMGRDPRFFTHPNKFDPSRWLTSSNVTQSHKTMSSSRFLLANFGFGARMCMGKRLAEMQMYEAISHVIRNYQISWESSTPMQLYSTGLLTPVDMTPLKMRRV